MEEPTQEMEEIVPIKLGTEVKNSIRHTFEALQQNNGKTSITGDVAKSKLKLVCANISQDLGIAYSSDDLDNFKADKKSLTCGEFVDYLEDELLPKGNSTDLQKEHKVFWTIVSQTFFKKDEHVLTEDETYKQWLIFNILDIDEMSRVHKEELGILLEKVCLAMGKVWNPVPLNEASEQEELTFWQYLECLEKHYLVECNRSVYQGALEEIVDYVINDILLQGFITKKGHMVKSAKNRWFVLKPGCLFYFTNRSRTDKKGEIVMNSNTKVAGIPDNKKYRFNVTCGDTKTSYDLEVKDQRMKQEWLVAIQKAIACSGGQSVQRKERLQRRLDRNERKLVKLEEDRQKREQESLVLAQQKELELLRQKYSDAEAQAVIEAENLQDEIRRREELEKLHLELQALLLAEKEAHEAEANARALQEELLLNEKKRLEEMEKMKAEQERLLEEEFKKRESLEERQKLQDKLLEEERKRLEELENERKAAEQAMKEANDKLVAAEAASRKAAEEAKRKAREIKTCTGLARPVGPHVPAFITHRGIGAFCENDFERMKKVKKAPPTVKPKPKRNVTNGETTNSLEAENGVNEEARSGEEEEDPNGDEADLEEEQQEENNDQGFVANDNEMLSHENVSESQTESAKKENDEENKSSESLDLTQDKPADTSQEETDKDAAVNSESKDEENKSSESLDLTQDKPADTSPEETDKDAVMNSESKDEEKITDTQKEALETTENVVQAKSDDPPNTVESTLEDVVQTKSDDQPNTEESTLEDVVQTKSDDPPNTEETNQASQTSIDGHSDQSNTDETSSDLKQNTQSTDTSVVPENETPES